MPRPAQAVDLDRYQGRWYELARYEQAFQKGCEGVTADYARRADGRIGVTNRCRRADGRVSVAQGRAKVASADNSRLKVSFFGPLYVGDYWILARGDDYRWAIVGDPSGRYLWLLHREPTPPEAEVAALVARAAGLGYDTRMLRRTRQP